MKSKINPLLSDLSNSEGFKYLEKAASKLVGNFDRNVHRAAIFLVLKVIPLLKEYSLKTQEFIMVKIYPIVIDGLSQLKVVFKTKVLPFLDNLLQLFYQGFTYLSNEINEFYKKFILPTIISTISRITNSEYYKAFINSGFVKDLVDLYGKFLKSSFAIQVYELFLVWFDGYLFLRNGVVCGVYGVDCDGVVEVYEAFKKLF